MTNLASPYTVTRQNGQRDIEALKALLAGDGLVDSDADVVQQIVERIEEQLPKPAIEEPPKDCVVMDITARSWLYDGDSEMWINEAMPESRLPWVDLLTLYADQPRVYYPAQDVAPEDTEDYKAGVEDYRAKMADVLRMKRSEALTAERQNAYDVMIGINGRLQP